MFHLDQLPGRVFQKEGQEWLYFSGTSYLGIPHNEVFHQALQDGFRRYGSNFGGSRLSNLQFEVFVEAEQYFAQWSGAAAALTLSSGTLAGQLCLSGLDHDAELHYAPGTHPALWGKGKPSQLSFSKWTQQMQDLSHKNAELILISNSIDPLRLEKYDFSFLSGMSKNCEITLVVDDSHGIGITGKNGSGFYSLIDPKPNLNLVVVASLGKALGLPGGIILGPDTFISNLKSLPFFGGASPIIPAYLYAFLRCPEVYELARQSLQDNIDLFQNAIATEQFRYQAAFPVFYTPQEVLAQKLTKYRILISSFSYPTPSDPLINRIVLNAMHTPADIELLTQKLQTILS